MQGSKYVNEFKIQVVFIRMKKRFKLFKSIRIGYFCEFFNELQDHRRC